MRTKNQEREAERLRLAREVEAFTAGGGTIEKAEPGRANPMNEDRHNSFLFLANKVRRARRAKP
ncbi:MAG: hypothetical protein IPF57_18280 [Gammaproteobacteria bacterium]|nr:hypothetical protein [Gammaproteobacteria bacterium]MBK8993020.1 hypothetical protein [Gammaproteobacteria bacterium]MBK9467276.1 hypothetical protein [Gammaproteobacteria bacterium]MBP6480045.1 hypothetical protein [Pseudomonadales bacterium]MBP7908386.1 hypothetical protein [Pseudomonadales bacterium]